MSKKPKFIDKQELKNRMAAGNKVRIAKGEMRDPAAPVARPDPRGAHFTKAQRKQFQALVTMAIYDLAHEDFSGWYEGLRHISRVMAAARFQKAVYINTCREIERVATEATGDVTLRARMHGWLGQQGKKIISIPGQRPGLASNDGAATNDPIPDYNDHQTARDGAERPTTDGETRRHKKGIH